MNLSQLLRGITVRRRIGDSDVAINSVQFDSRRVSAGDLFVCFAGQKADGHEYAAIAVNKGSAAVLCERELDLPAHVVQVVVDDARAAMALASGNFFGNPAANMCMLAVTGTNGKTTVTHLLKSIGEAFGKRVGLIGTNYTVIDQMVLEANATTPDPFELNGLLRRMADAGIQWVVMETSAHALWLRKLEGITFDVGVFTNFSKDHLNDFVTMEAYFAAKTHLFDSGRVRRAVLGGNDSKLAALAKAVPMPAVTFGTAPEADVRATEVRLLPRHVEMRLEAQGRGVDVSLAIPGMFSVENAAAAAAAALALDVPWPVIRCGLMQVKGVPGRMEIVPAPRGTFLVDYAHTPDALKKVLVTLRQATKGRLCVVFGCGGGRDLEKRPEMGEIAAELADFVVVTSDNPRNEKPEAIIDAIVKGVAKDTPLQVIPDRAQALAFAAEWAEEEDTVLVAGKGHETYQEIQGVKLAFCDRDVLTGIFEQTAQQT